MLPKGMNIGDKKGLSVISIIGIILLVLIVYIIVSLMVGSWLYFIPYILIAVIFISSRFYSLKLYENQKGYWWVFFYGVYFLFLYFPLTFYLTDIDAQGDGGLGYFILTFLTLSLILLAILISDIVLLVKSYKLSPRRAYFYNLLIVMIIATLPLLFYVLRGLILLR